MIQAIHTVDDYDRVMEKAIAAGLNTRMDQVIIITLDMIMDALMQSDEGKRGNA